MTRYADPQRCPDCREPMVYGAATCPSCGLSLQGPLAGELFATLTRADELVARIRATTTARVAVPAGGPAGAPAGGPAGAAVGAPSGPPPGGPGPAPLRPRSGLSAATVPQILLGLGAVCLLVAALVFLVVTWSVMGVAGRTATLVGFTALAGGLTAWVARRGLRAAAESLGLVALGLLAFDLLGARDAGWFGDMGFAAFLVLLGTTLTVAGSAATLAVRRTEARSLVGAEVVAVLGVTAVVVGEVETDWLAYSPALTVSVLLAGAAALAAHRLGLRVLAVGAGVVAAVAWLVLAISSWDRALQSPSARELWLQGEVWPLLVSAALAGAFAFATRLPSGARVTGLAVAELLLLAAALVPFTQESSTVMTLAVVGALAVTGILAWLAPTPWAHGLAAPVAVLGLWTTTVSMMLGVLAAKRLVDVGLDPAAVAEAYRLPRTGDLDPQLAPWLLPVVVLATCAAGLVLLRRVPAVDRLAGAVADPAVLGTVLAATGIATLSLYPVSTWLVLALVLAAAVLLAGWALRTSSHVALTLAAGFLAVGVVVSLQPDWPRLVAWGVGAALAGAIHLRWSRPGASATAGVLLTVLTAGSVWTGGALAGLDATWAAVTAIGVVAVLALSVPSLPLVRSGRTAGGSEVSTGVELGALVSMFALASLGLDAAHALPGSTATWAAVYLTTIGGAVTVESLIRSDRRLVAWLGGGLLAAASWVRLWDVGVEAPEAYTLPSAVVLALVGLLHLRRNPGAGTMTALAPALGLGLVPSLLWVLWDPIALRSVLLGMACLLLVAGGLRLRWTAPVLLGALVGLLVVLRLASPWAEAVPRWVLIGGAGTVLVVMGITWERRIQEARALVGHVRALR